MRIVAGKFRGRALANSDHLQLRPTTDKNREALFNILSVGKFIKEIGFEIQGAEVLDMCCGTGAVGFESLSRGAKSVTFVDLNRQHLAVVKKNAAALRVENDCDILCADAKKLPQNNKFFDLVFIDPPYAEDYFLIVENLTENGWIKTGSLIVVEMQTSKDLINFPKLKLLEIRQYGNTNFCFYRC